MIVITIEQIQYFLAVKEYNGFSIAAQELCISQSSLSKQIKALETELDTVLFDRASRVTTLTPAGEDFYVYAQNFLENYNSIIQGMQKHSLSKKLTLNVGTIAVLTQYGLNSIIASFKSEYPNIDINLFEDEHDGIINMLSKSEINLAIARDTDLDNSNFDIVTLVEDELVVVTSKNHPFAKKKYISFSDLKNQNFIMSTKSSLYKICAKECSKLGFTPKVVHNISKIETILGLVSESLGITLMVNNVLKPFKGNNISVHPLKDPIRCDLALVTNINTPKSNEFNLFKEYIIKNTCK